MSEQPSIGAYPTHHDAPIDHYRSGRGAGITSIVLIAVAVALTVAGAVAAWQAWSAVDGYTQGTGPTQDDAVAAAHRLLAFAGYQLLATVAAGVAFLIWVARVRGNAVLIAGEQSQRRSHGWAIGGWVCPIVNLWFPYQIMADIYRASARRAGSQIVGWWWAALMSNVILSDIVVRVISSGPVSTDMVRSDAVVLSVCAVLIVVAGVLISMIVLRINRWQELPTDPLPSPLAW